ncbi:MAG: hypothetical protein PHX70_03695 [Clostridium sp.]|nr:hypothetical protein [Clostridium sp.]
MELKEKKLVNRNKKTKSTIFLYCAAVVVALIGIALLINNIVLVKKTISQYVAQGYSASTVMQSMLYSTLLPDIFNSIGIYGGIAAALFGIGKINDKISLAALDTKEDPSKEVAVSTNDEENIEKKETEDNKEDEISK